MSASHLPAGTRAQVAAILFVPLLVFAIGFLALPTPSSMSAARAGTDREALKELLVKRIPKGATKLDIALDNTIQIVGSQPPRGALKPGGKLVLDVFLKSLKGTDRDWTIFLHIDRRGGAYRIHGDHEPADGRYATSLWRTGEIVRDHFTKRIPVDAPSGTYDIWMGLYIKKQRMKFTRGDATRHDGDNRIRVGTLTVK